MSSVGILELGLSPELLIAVVNLFLQVLPLLVSELDALL